MKKIGKIVNPEKTSLTHPSQLFNLKPNIGFSQLKLTQILTIEVDTNDSRVVEPAAPKD